MSTAVRGERAWCVVVPHHARGARMARERLAIELHGLVSAELLSDTIAVAAELVGNAVRHADPLPGGVVRVGWRLRFEPETTIELRVTDGGAERPPLPRAAGPEAQDGRGLAIVAALAVRWGVDRDGVGQCVWAELGPVRRAQAPVSSRPES